MGAVRRAHWSGAGVKTARWEARCDDALPPCVSGCLRAGGGPGHGRAGMCLDARARDARPSRPPMDRYSTLLCKLRSLDALFMRTWHGIVSSVHRREHHQPEAVWCS